ncbi:LytR/AlgR family response regulator transcription factor [Costertonia aggregata]|uniref:Response regulator transcription factor n=1 Tax=Costertonia aggregata TaxID=343403 RepID=A0A7H9API1_9FLAO|nr:LytTR family DNA-binding domain-containing protein [Costertonia aggregata]QLG45327.1 response regulator transcription factor [Costertonia aggregata]
MNCIIIEDEIPAQRILQNYISKVPGLELKESYQSALEANAVIQENTVDIIFLDINLPDISGLRYIKTLSSPPCVIMTTAYHEHAVESFELDTICDYLVKPFSFDRFLKAVNKAKRHLRPNTTALDNQKTDAKTLFLNVDKTLHKVYLNDILYIESDKNYVTVVTANNQYSYLESLKNWILKLPEEDFVQIHKSYIVNIKAITKINGNLLFINEQKIPVGRSFKPKLVDKLDLN